MVRWKVFRFNRRQDRRRRTMIRIDELGVVTEDMLGGEIVGGVVPSSELDVSELLGRHARTLAEHFNTFRSRFIAIPPRLIDAIEYSLTAGGKRLRPALVLECWKACADEQSNTGDDSSYRSALAAAAAVELIHTFSLVHDDLPAMDDDDLRRGRPTNHKVFGEAMAILAGDAMVTLAFEVLATDAQPQSVPGLVRTLAWASGPEGMIGGQVLDIDGENVSLNLDQLKRLHGMKTGALLAASCRLGAIAAGADDATVQAMSRYGAHLGLAFQIVDDLLDVLSTPEQLGKATKKDAGKGKNTYPTLLGLDASRHEAERQLVSAIDALKPLGDRGHALAALAQFAVRRDR
jgi:geranylgeranyl diphosphate synthase type II